MTTIRSKTTIIDRLGEEAGAGALPDRDAVLPAIPPCGTDLLSVVKTVKAIKQVIEAREGDSMSVMDKAVTVRDLTDMGVCIKIGDQVFGDPLNSPTPTPTPVSVGFPQVGYVDPRPFLLTPPTPSNVLVNGAVQTIFVSWTLADYRNHSYCEVWRNTTNNLATAVQIGTSLGSQYVDATGAMGVTYFYWIRASGVDAEGDVIKGAYSTVASGGRGQVGGVDLGPLIVEAANIANNAVVTNKLADAAVTAAKLIDNAVTAQKIVDGAVITAKLADAGVTSSKIVDGGVVTAKLADAAVTSAKLIDNAVTAQKIVAGAVTATKLNVQIGGGNLLPNSNFLLPTPGDAAMPLGWGSYNNNFISLTYATNGGGLFGTNYARVTTNATGADTVGWVTRTSVPSGGVKSWVPGLTYVISFWARASSSAFSGRVLTGLFSNMGFAEVTALETPALINGTWQRYSWRVKPNDNGFTPFGELYISWDLTSGGALPAGASYDICAVQVEQGEIASAYAPKPAELLPGVITATEIADNAVTTPKLVAGAVVAGKIAANAVGANEIAAGAVVAGKIAANAVTANEIAANAVIAGKIAANAVTADAVAANAITTGKLLVVGGDGASLWPDTNFKDPTAWVVANWGAFPTQATISDGIAGGTSLRSPTGSDASARGARRIAVTVGKTYRLSIYARRSADSNGTLYYRIDGDTTESGGYNERGYWIESQVPGTSWTRYTATVTAAQPFWSPMVLVNYNATAGWMEAQDIRIEEVIPGELIVDGAITAGKVATNAITTDKIAANAVAAGKIAANAVTANELAANSVVAGKIATNAVTADAVAASAITTAKLLVVDQGLCLNADPNTRDLSAWVYWGSMAVVNDTSSPTGGTVIEAVNNGTLLSRSAAIDPTRNYEFRIWIKQQAGSSPTYLTVAFQDAAGNNISGGGGNWPSTGTYFYFGLLNQTPSGTWTEYRISFGPNETAQIPSGARFCSVGFLANYATTGTQRVTGIRLMQKADAELIVDGAITANKVAANAIVAGKIAANAIGASNIIAGTITGDRLAAATIAGDRISANTITAANIATSTITGDRIAANTITGGNIAATTITAGNIAAGAVSADKISSGIGGKNMVWNDGTSLIDPRRNWFFTYGISGALAADSWDPYKPNGQGGWYMRAPSATIADSTLYAIMDNYGGGPSGSLSETFPVEGGKRYEYHALIYTHRAKGQLVIYYYDASNNLIVDRYSSVQTNGYGTWNDSNQSAHRLGMFDTAPANARKAILRVFAYGTGQNDPYVFCSRVYFGEANTNQTEFSPYSPSAPNTRIEGGTIRTGTITADRLSVSQLSAIAADVGLLRTASSGGRMEIQANQQRVYDTSGVERVRIGYLL